MKWALTQSKVEPHMTHKQIAKEMGVSRGFVTHLEASALKKVRLYCRNHKLKIEDLL